MGAPEHKDDGSQRRPPVSGEDIEAVGNAWRLRPVVVRFKRWAFEHSGEILWALLFAVLAGYAFALYLEEPKPYKIYVVVDHDTDRETLRQLQAQDQKDQVAQIGHVKVQVQLEVLPDQKPDTAKDEATKLANLPDTLLVIEHGRSQKVERSLQTYFGARPQIPLITTVATDDNLLQFCDSSTSQATVASDQLESCYDGTWFSSFSPIPQRFAPLLQLSPTNDVQGRSAVMFATQSGHRHFLIVSGKDPEDQSYTEDMERSYSEAIHAAHAELVGVQPMNPLPTAADLERRKPDCILFAGGVGEAQTLLRILSSIPSREISLTILLSDSVIQSRGKDADLAEFSPREPQTLQSPTALARAPPSGDGLTTRSRTKGHQAGLPVLQATVPVHFTDQSDAHDYNSHKNQYVDDAFSIALQIISDLNGRGYDIAFRVRSFLHIQTVQDARRNLLRIMRQNFSSRAWYKSANGITPYVFDGNKPYGGIFHVWQLKPSSSQPGSEMEDVDNWHPPRPSTD
jgi:hypothetical protein